MTRVEAFTGGGRFEIHRELGEGGFGTVYAAFDREFGVPVALKRLHSQSPEALYRFKKEFRSLAGVVHPNLVSLYELFQVGEEWYFTMELVQGRHLFDHLRPGQPEPASESTLVARPQQLRERGPAAPSVLPDLQALRGAFVQLARALHALHGAGLLHRDIKSSNVLVTGEGRVVVLDFGLVTESRPADDGDGMVVGTPHYMSPEQWMGGLVTEASDWYSFGVVLYEALTGIPPYDGSVTDLALNKLKDAPPPPRSLDPGIPEDLDRLCLQLLCIDPSSRPRGPEIIRCLGGEAQAELGGDRASRAFVGRRAELSALTDAFHTATGGRANTVHLFGDSGIGKTTLFDKFLQTVQRLKPVVLRGRCYAQESLPYKALDGAMDELSRFLGLVPPAELKAYLPDHMDDLACLFPVLRRVAGVGEAPERPATETRRLAAGALRELLRRIGAARPVIIYLDDVHWGDVDSVGLIHALLAPPDAPPILLVLAYRDDEQETSPFFRELRALEVVSGARADERRIALLRMPAAECERLAETLLERRPMRAGALSRIAREAAGNPLFVEELVRYARTTGGEAGAVSEAEDATPDSEERRVLLNGMIQRRIDELPAEWQRLVEVLGVAGQPIDVEVARQAAGLGSVDGTVLNRLRAVHLVRTRPHEGREQIAPYHDRIREIVVAGLGSEERETLHREIAEALVRSGRARPGLIANHLRRGGALDRAADYAYQAAEQAARALAFDDAAELYGQVIEWNRGDAARARHLLRRHADALANAGRCADAAPRYLEAAEGLAAHERLDLRRLACEQYLVGGMTGEGMALLEELCDEVGVSCPRTPTRAMLATAGDLLRLKLRGLSFSERSLEGLPAGERVRIDICYSAGRNLLLRDPMLAFRFNVRALRFALDAGEPARIVEGLSSVGMGLDMQGLRDGHKMLRLAHEIADRVDSPSVRGLLLLWAAFVDHGAARWERSLEAWDEAVGLLGRSGGLTSEKQKAQLNGILAVQLLGRFEELRGRTERAMTEARATGNRYTEVYARLYSAIPMLAAGDVEGCRTRMSDALARAPAGDHYTAVTALKFFCYCDLYDGDAEAGLRRVEGAWPGLERSGMMRVPHFRVTFHGLRGSLALQACAEAPARAKRLLGLAEADLRRVAKERYPFAVGHAHLLRAGLALARGDRPAARARAGDALAAFGAGGLALEESYARRWVGVLRDDAEGAALIAESDAFLRARGVADPARWTHSQAPGLSPSLSRKAHDVAT